MTLCHECWIQGVSELLDLGDYPKHSFYLNFVSYLLYIWHLLGIRTIKIKVLPPVFRSLWAIRERNKETAGKHNVLWNPGGQTLTGTGSLKRPWLEKTCRDSLHGRTLQGEETVMKNYSKVRHTAWRNMERKWQSWKRVRFRIQILGFCDLTMPHIPMGLSKFM